MIWVALFRNLNLGHPGSPSRMELVEAFGGSTVARTFQTNGTVVFESSAPEETTAAALVALRSAGYAQSAAVRSLREISQAVAEAPVIDSAENIYRSMISFYDADEVPDLRLPLRSPDRLVELRTLTPTHAHSVCWKPRNTAGNVTGFLEHLLRVPVTTRTTATLQRLLRTQAVD